MISSDDYYGTLVFFPVADFSATASVVDFIVLFASICDSCIILVTCCWLLLC